MCKLRDYYEYNQINGQNYYNVFICGGLNRYVDISLSYGA